MAGTEQKNADVFDLSLLISRYCRYVDDHDGSGMKECLTEDVEAFHTLMGPVKGRDQFLGVITMTPPHLKLTQHYCTNQEITIDGDRAQCRSYVYAQHLVAVGNEDVLMPGGARYLHEFIRTSDGWRISKIRCDVTWADPRLADVYKP
jgi:hypothetical protein